MTSVDCTRRGTGSAHARSSCGCKEWSCSLPLTPRRSIRRIPPNARSFATFPTTNRAFAEGASTRASRTCRQTGPSSPTKGRSSVYAHLLCLRRGRICGFIPLQMRTFKPRGKTPEAGRRRHSRLRRCVAGDQSLGEEAYGLAGSPSRETAGGGGASSGDDAYPDRQR
jgi:hypothetical protein